MLLSTLVDEPLQFFRTLACNRFSAWLAVPLPEYYRYQAGIALQHLVVMILAAVAAGTKPAAAVASKAIVAAILAVVKVVLMRRESVVLNPRSPYC